MEDFLYSAKIRELILMSYFTRSLQRLVSFGSAEKCEKLILLLNCKSRVDLQCLENTVFKNLCSLRMLKAADCKKFTQIYLRLPVLGKCLKWMFQISLRSFSVGRDSLEVKKIIKVKFL